MSEEKPPKNNNNQITTCRGSTRSMTTTKTIAKTTIMITIIATLLTNTKTLQRYYTHDKIKITTTTATEIIKTTIKNRVKPH